MPRLRSTFRSLRTRNYRLFYAGQLVSVSGTWCQQVALSWVVYRLTGSGVALGTVTALSLLPMLVAGPWGGLLADRFDKRTVLIAANAGLAGIAAALAALTLAGAADLWVLYLLALLSGIGSAVEIPTRQAFVNELVQPDDLANAIGLNSAMFNASRVVGPAVAGALLAVTSGGWCFAVNAASYAAVIVAYRRMRPDELRRAPRQARERGQLRQGVAAAWGEPVVRRTTLLVGVVALAAFNHPIVLPLLAERTFGGGAGMFSALTATMAAGSVVGALTVAAKGAPSDRVLLGAGTAYGALLLAASLTSWLPLALPLLCLAGGAGVAFVSTANARVQLASPPDVRGRVMAIYALIFLGSTPIGAPAVGWIAEHLGPRVALGGGGALAGATVLAVLLRPALADRRARRSALAEPLPEAAPVPA